VYDDLPKIDVTPILELRQIRSILMVRCTIDLTNITLRRMFTAWPNLKCLDMECQDVSNAISLSHFSAALRYASPCLKVLRGLWVECDPECIPSQGRASYPNLEYLHFLIHYCPNRKLSRGPLIHYLMSTFPGVDLMRFSADLWDDPRSIMLAFGAQRARKAGHTWTLEEFNESDYRAYQRTDSGTIQSRTQMKGYNALYLLPRASPGSTSLKPKPGYKQNALSDQRMAPSMSRKYRIQPHYHVPIFKRDHLPLSMRNVGHAVTGHDERRGEDW
jgi:hypothetical protein